MKHLSDEDLAILVPGEEPDGEVGAHLKECPACRSRRAIFQEVIGLVWATERLPRRDDSYGRDVWARLSPRLPERRKGSWARFFAPALTVAFARSGDSSRRDPEAPGGANPRSRVASNCFGERCRTGLSRPLRPNLLARFPS